MRDNGETAGIAFYNKEGEEILFASKILRVNWAKEDHDGIKTIELNDGERLLGIKCG